jgi:hypothetical protein
MKVKKLIEYLMKFDPEAVVRMNDKDGGELLAVVQLANDHSFVWLESEHDMDIKEEYNARTDWATEVNMEECDYYNWMIDDGYTPHMIRKHISDEEARLMEFKCREYGCGMDYVEITMDELESWYLFIKHKNDRYYVNPKKKPCVGDFVYMYDIDLDSIFTMVVNHVAHINDDYYSGNKYFTTVIYKDYILYVDYK